MLSQTPEQTRYVQAAKGKTVLVLLRKSLSFDNTSHQSYPSMRILATVTFSYRNGLSRFVLKRKTMRPKVSEEIEVGRNQNSGVSMQSLQ
jgi:hypothetical protein